MSLSGYEPLALNAKRLEVLCKKDRCVMNQLRRRREEGRLIEWRSYQISGSPQMLEGIEEVLRRLMRVSGQDETQIVSVVFRGACAVKLGMQSLGSWEDLEDESEPLPESLQEAPEFCSVVWIDRQS